MNSSASPTSSLKPASASLRKNLAYSIYDGLTAMPISYLILPGNFIIAAMLVELFQLHPSTYGLIVALPFLGNFLQTFVIHSLSRRFSLKALTIAHASTQLTAWGAMAIALPFLPIDNPQQSGRWLIAFFSLSAMSGAIASVSWISWVQEWVPRRVRGKFFGKRNRVTQLSQTLFLLICGQIIGQTSVSVTTFQVILLSAVFLRVLSVSFLVRTRTEPPRQPNSAKPAVHWKEQLRTLAHSKNFLLFVLYGAAWGFAANSSGAFYPVFMYKVLNLSVSEVSIFVLLSGIGGFLSFPAWGALSDRYGNKPVMLLGMILWQFQNYFWCILTPGNAWLLYPMWLFGGIVAAGFTLGLFNIQLKIIPVSAKTLAISFNLAITSLVTATAPIVTGVLLERFLAGSSNILRTYHLFFLATPTLGLLACLILRKIQEPASAKLSIVIGAMRNTRTLGSILGLGFLVDHVFVRRPKQRQKR